MGDAGCWMLDVKNGMLNEMNIHLHCLVNLNGSLVSTVSITGSILNRTDSFLLCKLIAYSNDVLNSSLFGVNIPPAIKMG